MKKAIVTLIIGDKYYKLWEKYAKESWEKYCKIHNYDLIVLDKILDHSQRAKERTVIWQKCLILEEPEVQKYDRIVWLDADIVINYHNAPCVIKDVPDGHIAATNAWKFPDYETYNEIWQRNKKYVDWHGFGFHGKGEELYTECGLSPESYDVLQAGVLVLEPKLHRKLFWDVYYNYEKKIGNSKELVDEMRALSHILFKEKKYPIFWLDYKFNYLTESFKTLYYPFLYPKTFLGRIKRLIRFQFGKNTVNEKAINAAYLQSYFLHFAGNGKEIKLVKTRISNHSDYAEKYCE